jgi:hypothetical protein
MVTASGYGTHIGAPAPNRKCRRTLLTGEGEGAEKEGPGILHDHPQIREGTTPTTPFWIPYWVQQRRQLGSVENDAHRQRELLHPDWQQRTMCVDDAWWQRVHECGALERGAVFDGCWGRHLEVQILLGDLLYFVLVICFCLGGNSPATQKLPPIRPLGYSAIIFGNEPEQA